MADWTLSKEHVHAIREARAALLAAAATGEPTRLERAIAHAVPVMLEADFSRSTICSLVSAAVDTGLPRRRGYVRREDDVRAWAGRAAAAVDALEGATRRRRGVS